jgi:hypothetical protein
MMSEKTQVYLYTVAAFVGGAVMLTYTIKILFWVLLYSMIHPVNALGALAACGLAYYAMNKH